jgi:hypothetical protein
MKKGRKSGLWLVGAGGLEPPTPTVSTEGKGIFNTYMHSHGLAWTSVDVRNIANEDC